MNEYIKQAQDFLKATNSRITMQQIRPELAQRPTWAEEGKISHGHEYRVAIIRNEGNADMKDYRFTFWDSVNNAQNYKRPSVYDILATLSGSIYAPDTLDDFISEYGYEIDGKKSYDKVRATFKGVRSESKALKNLFTDEELEQLAEIQ